MHHSFCMFDGAPILSESQR